MQNIKNQRYLWLFIIRKFIYCSLLFILNFYIKRMDIANMKKLIAGNWKMNMNREDAIKLAFSLVSFASESPKIDDKCDILLCPPFTYISQVKEICKDSVISVGAQDCSFHENGAYTGEISANMLYDIGCNYVIIGHSERRQYHGETDDIVLNKVCAARQEGLISIVCIGETKEERDKKKHEDIIISQLAASIPDGMNSQNIVIAYEPVWAIGTGKTASPDDVFDMHKLIRSELKSRFSDGSDIRILYGGSMKPDNAKQLLSIENVDGGLIGGASLKADQFTSIIQKA